MLKNAFWLFIATIFVFLCFLPSYTQMQDLKQKNSEYSYKIKQLVDDNARLQEERKLLETDPEYLEKVAREKMGLIRNGEVIYKFVPATNRVAP